MNRKLFLYIFILWIQFLTLHGFNSFEEFKNALFEKEVFQELIGQDAKYNSERFKHFPGEAKKDTDQDPALQKAGNIINFYEFQETLQLALTFLESQYQQQNWLNGHVFDLESMHLLDEERKSYSNDPRLSKIIEIATIFPQDHVLQIVGDQHACGHDTALFLNWAFNSNKPIFKNNSWQIKDEYKNIHWIFAGDITDSGAYGVESLYAILKTFNANPENIHIIRGNHEAYFTNKTYGFYGELKGKFPNIDLEERVSLYFDFIYKLYCYLPAAFWVSFENNNTYDWTLICHGGIHEDDTEINDLFVAAQNSIGTNRQAAKFVHNAKKLGGEYITGYMWADFLPDADGYQLSERGTDFMDLGENKTKKFLQKHSSESHAWNKIIRAHQHTMGGFKNLMPDIFLNKGMSLLWNEDNPMVTTLSVMPCTGFGIPKNSGITYQQYYPGIIYLAAATLSHDTLEFYNLSNQHIPEWTKELHQEAMTAIKNRYNDDNQKYIDALENYQVTDIMQSEKIKTINLKENRQISSLYFDVLKKEINKPIDFNQNLYSYLTEIDELNEKVKEFENNQALSRKQVIVLNDDLIKKEENLLELIKFKSNLDTITSESRDLDVMSIEDLDSHYNKINPLLDSIIDLKDKKLLSKDKAAKLAQVLLEEGKKTQNFIELRSEESTKKSPTRKKRPQEKQQPIQVMPSLQLSLPSPVSYNRPLTDYLTYLSQYFASLKNNNALSINHQNAPIRNLVEYFNYIYQVTVQLQNNARNEQEFQDLQYIARFFSEMIGYLRNQIFYNQHLMNTVFNHQEYLFNNSLQYFDFISNYLLQEAQWAAQQRR